MSIASIVALIRNASRGKEVRESIASGIEYIDAEVLGNIVKQNILESQFNGIVASAGSSNTEIVAGRTSNITGETSDTIGHRIDKVDTNFLEKDANFRTIQNNIINFNGAIVTFIDDDATWLYPSWWDSIIAAKNINISLAAVTSKVGTGGYMTLQQLKDRQTQGNDVVSHTKTHPDFGTLTTTQAEIECKDSQQWLKDNGFEGYETIVYSGGLTSTNVALKDVARKYYKYGVATWDADSIYTNTMPVDNWALKRIFIATNTLEQLKSAVDSANANNQWLIVLSHSADFTQAEVDKLNGFIDYVQSQSVPILKFSEAVKYKGNSIALGEYTNANSTFIGVNGSIKSPAKTSIINSNTSTNIMDANISTYEKDKTTRKVLDGDTDTLIHNGGVVDVFRSSNSDVYSIATFYPYETNRIYTRRWNVGGNAWKSWERVDKTDIALTVNAGDILAQPITYFEKRMIYINPVSDSSSSPDGTNGGILTTYRMIDDTYSYQTYKLYNAKTTYSRRWVTSAWSAWELLY